MSLSVKCHLSTESPQQWLSSAGCGLTVTLHGAEAELQPHWVMQGVAKSSGRMQVYVSVTVRITINRCYRKLLVS